ncbi:hypothetical protein F4777DRAFT_590689 [Nemania sp. FL0916]|nr:hypothetical protein F4777DRAFT_590689 [Nemania sp. FL0916]
MSDAERSLPSERRPACDNCKTRKTKCDRRTPCSSCVTLEVACRTSNRATEKRQRVVLSTRYEDAVQDVSSQLADVKLMLQALVANNKDASGPSTSVLRSQEPSSSSLDAPAYTPQSMIDEQVPTLDSVQEGYHNDTSFTSHAHQIKTTLEATLSPNDFEFPLSATMDNAPGQAANEASKANFNPSLQLHDVGVGSMQLPPNEIVLKLLRLLKTEEQRFFIDVPLFDEDEFIAMCREIYFPTEPISLWSWIIVNVGLNGLFSGIREESCKNIGVSSEELRAGTKILRANSDAALRSLRLCSEPSLEYCRALVVLANYYVRLGHSTIAWRLMSGSARAALDLGLHRLPRSTSTTHVPREVALFWHIYTWEKGLAMTCGKSPTIRHSDVTSALDFLSTPANRRGRIRILYGAFVDMAVIMGEIQESLFSIVAQQSSQQIRIQHVHRLATRLIELIKTLETLDPDGPSWEDLLANNLGGMTTTLHVVFHCQLAIVYRFLPPEYLNAHPLQCSIACVNEARVAISMLVRVGEAVKATHIGEWTVLLNILLSLVPLVPFIVLAGNAIATSSGDDLPLLSRMIAILAPSATRSPLVRKVHGACESLSKIAERVVSSTTPPPPPILGQGQHHQQYPGPHGHGQEQFDYAGFPMGQQDWDTVITGTGFESSEFGNYDSRTLTNIIEPCFANAYW